MAHAAFGGPIDSFYDKDKNINLRRGIYNKHIKGTKFDLLPAWMYER